MGEYVDHRFSLGEPTDLSVVSTLHYARAAYLAREICAIVGDFEKERYAVLYEKIKNAFRNRFIDSDGRFFLTPKVLVLSHTRSASFRLTTSGNFQKLCFW